MSSDVGSLNGSLESAIRRGDVNAVRDLIARGVDLSSILATNSQTALHLAATQKKSGAIIARLLIEKGAKIEATTSAGARTPLHMAAIAGSVEALRVLVDAGADVCAEDSLKRTPLHCAADAGHKDALVALLDLGVAVDQCVPDRSFTALMCGAYSNRMDICEVLLDRGADVGINAPITGTALHMAAKHGHLEVCRLLVTRGADPERVEALLWGRARSACQLAVEEKESHLVKFFLFECGCDPFVLTGEGKSLMDLANGGPQTSAVVLAAQSQRIIEQSITCIESEGEQRPTRGMSPGL